MAKFSRDRFPPGFFDLSGGLYGADADRVENIAEEYTEGGELVITDVLAGELLEAHGFTLRQREGLPPELTNFRYPVPYSEDFYATLLPYARTRRHSVIPEPAYER